MGAVTAVGGSEVCGSSDTIVRSEVYAGRGREVYVGAVTAVEAVKSMWEQL